MEEGGGMKVRRSVLVGDLVVEMVYEKETKHTFRYREKGPGPVVIGTLYIQKWAIPTHPSTIIVRVDEQEEERKILPCQGEGESAAFSRRGEKE